MSWLNIEQKISSGLFADGLGALPKCNPETCHYNFDPPQREWLPLRGPLGGSLYHTEMQLNFKNEIFLSRISRSFSANFTCDAEKLVYSYKLDD